MLRVGKKQPVLVSEFGNEHLYHAISCWREAKILPGQVVLSEASGTTNDAQKHFLESVSNFIHDGNKQVLIAFAAADTKLQVCFFQQLVQFANRHLTQIDISQCFQQTHSKD